MRAAPALRAGPSEVGGEDAAFPVPAAAHGPRVARPVNPSKANLMTFVISDARHPALPGARARL